MKRSSKHLASFITISLLTGAYACSLMATAQAKTVVVSTPPLLELDIYDNGETVSLPNGEKIASTLTRSSWEKSKLAQAANYWAEILGPGALGPSPATITVVGMADMVTQHQGAAFTQPYYFKVPGLAPGMALVDVQARILGHDAPINTYLVFGNSFALPEGAAVPADDTPLPQATTNDLYASATHELGHALGIGSFAGNTPATSQDYGRNAQSLNGVIGAYDNLLYDWRGVKARPNMTIRHEGESEPAGTYFDAPGSYYDPDRFEASGVKASYLTGNHIQEVLQGAFLTSYNQAGYAQDQKVPGIPVNVANLSHLELRNGLMSHQILTGPARITLPRETGGGMNHGQSITN